MDKDFNFINDGFNDDLRPPTTDSQNPNVNYNASYNCNNNNNNPTMDDNVSSASYTNTSGNVTMSSQSYPTTSSDPPHPLVPQYTQQQIQQVQQPGYNQNGENNNIQQQFLNTTQPITQNVPYFIQNNSQINHSEILTFEIPGIKIIVIPTFPPMLNSSRTNHSEIFTFDIPGTFNIYEKDVFGKNILSVKKTKSILELMWIAMQEKVLILLIIAAVVSLGHCLYEDFGVKDLTIEVKDWQKQRQFQKLNAKKEDRNVKVTRNGKEALLTVLNIEPGDVISVDGVVH
ncbi:hypothetical protein C1646_753418 [Rhizophagus diaphanus]|nr:hypothetical protein C1646_753418 [Rhizophagus diaphanus] [Rhizophagus sp. MUCL 43196]